MAFDLPENPPVPEQRPDGGAAVEAPVTEEKPAAEENEAAEEEAVEKVGEDLPDEPPMPEERAENPPPPDPKPPEEDEGEFLRCTAALTALGAQFDVLAPIDGEGACGMARPLKVTAVMEGVELSPEGTMRCKTALALATWAKAYVEPTAKIALSADARLVGVEQASAYVCRGRNGVSGAKISEHAKGNAVDVRSLSFSDGTTVEMLPRTKDGSATGAFQRTVSAAACLYFMTVLSPGSDATHQDHMHLDVIERNGGYRYCR
ncbi:extensin-like domain-containing protein [Martelella soudanensis]|uniref:extensin-like domain-containing protein n=1 Tax=unclassified Martelella TaxID=2629616 RepID=UPI0015DD6CD2|nr:MULTISPECIES: extensin family protein [unclassified Martelella]